MEWFSPPHAFLHLSEASLGLPVCVVLVVRESGACAGCARCVAVACAEPIALARTIDRAEHLAVWAWERLEDLPLHEIQVWETPTSFVTYHGPPSADG